MLDDRLSAHDQIAGTKDYMKEEWRNRNQELGDAGFSQDNAMGENEWLKYIS